MKSLWQGIKAYLPPLALGAQGAALLVFLGRWSGEEVSFSLVLALGALIFSSYLFEGMGFFSPEDKINQPQRFDYFHAHAPSAFLVVVLAAGAGVFLAGARLFELRIFLSLVSTAVLFTLYSIFRWKKGGLLKPLMVSLAWMSALWGLSAADFSKDFPVLTLLFCLLFLDSLWLDLRDKKGDGEYGFKIGHLNRHPFALLWVAHLILAGLIFWRMPEAFFLNAANVILVLSAMLGFYFLPRWLYGMVIPFWAFFLGIFF
jgi:hypothetical protein